MRGITDLGTEDAGFLPMTYDKQRAESFVGNAEPLTDDFAPADQPLTSEEE